MTLSSLWQDRSAPQPVDPGEVSGRYDVAVVGAGLTGLTTALLLARELAGKGLRVSRIASGVPHGGDLEFADQITLGRAVDGRRSMDGKSRP